jgi:HPt (histidine-containing phosphotransfer) domain-containing protein
VSAVGVPGSRRTFLQTSVICFLFPNRNSNQHGAIHLPRTSQRPRSLIDHTWNTLPGSNKLPCYLKIIEQQCREGIKLYKKPVQLLGLTLEQAMSHVIVSASTILDPRAAMTRLGGDAELYSDLIEFFLVDAPDLLKDLWSAIEADNATEVRMKAHALKGLIAGCGGVRAVAVAQQIENIAQSGDPEELPSLAQSLEAEVDALIQLLLPHRRRTT